MMSQGSQISKPNIPDRLYNELFDFIILEVEKGPTDPNNGGVYAQRLTKVYLDHYLDLTRLEDEAYVKREKKLITKLLWWLVEEKVLKLVKRASGGTGFIVDPNYKNKQFVAKDMDVGFIRLRGADGAGEQPADEEYTINTNRSVEQVKKEKLNERQHPQQNNYLDEQGLTRDIEIDDDITRAGAPLPAPSVSPIPGTPSKKRKISDVIADSNESSHSESSSPDSSPDRTPKRRVTPEQTRRPSEAPHSVKLMPNSANTPQRRKFAEGGTTPIPLKFETKSTVKDPEMVRLLTELRTRYPMDRIDICSEYGFLECKDCEKSYKAWTSGANPKATANNMIAHLKSKAHRDTARVARSLETRTTSSTCQMEQFTNVTSIQPVQVYSMPNIQIDVVPKGDPTKEAWYGAKASLLQFMDIIEKDTMTQAERNRTLDEKFSATEMLNREMAEKMSEMITATVKKSEIHHEEIDRKLATFEAQSRIQTANVDQQFLETERKMQKVVDNLKEEVVKSEAGAKKRVELLGEQLATLEKTTDAEIISMGGKIESCVVRTEDQYRKMSEQVTMLEAEKNREYEKMTNLITSLGEVNEEQSEECDRLGATLQVHTEALEQYQRNEAELRSTIAIHLKENAELVEKLEKETSELFRALEQANVEKIKSLECITSKRIEALEKETAIKVESVQQVTSETIQRIENTYGANMRSLAHLISDQSSKICELNHEKEAQAEKLEKLNLVLPKLIDELGVYHSIAEVFVKQPAHTPTPAKFVKNRTSVRQAPRRVRKFPRPNIVKRRRSSMKLPSNFSRASTLGSS